MEKENGLQAVMMRTSYNCNTCKDTFWIIDDGKAKRCTCYEINKAKAIWEASGVNLEQREKTFKSFVPYNEQSEIAKSKAVEYYKSYDSIKDSKHNSIAFLGQVGSGKTHLSMALAINFLEKGVPVVYMPFRDVMMDIKLNILDQDYYKRAIERFQKCEVLLIDDLFKGKVTGSDVNIMFEIINYRYLNRKAVIVSSERDIDGLIGVDEGIGSRIYEMAKYNIVEIKGRINNYRMKE